MAEINYEERVARGIALLDEKVPGWVEHIDLEKLDIMGGSQCVTAQVAGWKTDTFDFRDGMDLLGLWTNEDNGGSYTSHGFNAEADWARDLPEGYDQSAAYVELTRIWKRVISARQQDGV